jgi:hypothetical protein
VSNKGKRVPQVQDLPHSREVRLDQNPQAYRTQKPSWRLGTLDKGGPWCYWTATQKHVDDLHGRLSSFESMTWAEIEKAPSCGPIERSVLGVQAQKRLEEINNPAERLVKLRIGKSERVWGIREGATLKVLWWDPEHTVYPMDIKDNRN